MWTLSILVDFHFFWVFQRASFSSAVVISFNSCSSNPLHCASSFFSYSAFSLNSLCVPHISFFRIFQYSSQRLFVLILIPCRTSFCLTWRCYFFIPTNSLNFKLHFLFQGFLQWWLVFLFPHSEFFLPFIKFSWFNFSTA